MHITEKLVSTVVNRVRRKLNVLRETKGISLQVLDRDYHLEDGWLCILVIAQCGIRATEYANIVCNLEKTLRAENFENVLIMPASPND
jgi:streptomycin 6-kinase